MGTKSLYFKFLLQIKGFKPVFEYEIHFINFLKLSGVGEANKLAKTIYPQTTLGARQTDSQSALNYEMTL